MISRYPALSLIIFSGFFVFLLLSSNCTAATTVTYPCCVCTVTAAACPNLRRQIHATPLPLSCQHRRLLFARAAKRRSAAPHLLAKGRCRQYRGLARVVVWHEPRLPPTPATCRRDHDSSTSAMVRCGGFCCHPVSTIAA